jgi:hypothetical protein
MKDRLKSAVSGLSFCLTWWVIYSSPFARILDGFVVATLVGGIVWMTWDIYRWMYRGRVLGPTELAIKPQYPRAVVGVPFAVLASTLVIVTSGWHPPFPSRALGGICCCRWRGCSRSLVGHAYESY